MIRKTSAAEKAKESRQAKVKSDEDYPWTDLLQDVTTLKKLRVSELNKYLNHDGAEAAFEKQQK